MKWFKNLKVSHKLQLSFAILSLVIGIVGYQGLTGMSTINDMLNDLYEKEALGLSHLKEANVNLLYFGRAQNNFLLSSSSEERNRHLNRMEMYEKMLREQLDIASPLIYTEKGKELLAQFDVLWKDYRSVVDQVVALGKLENLQSYRESVTLAQTTAREKVDEIDTLFSQLSRLKEQNGQAAYDESNVVYSEARLYLIFLILGAIGLGTVFGLFISKMIGQPIQKVSEMIQEMRSGHLHMRLNLNQKDEIGVMADAMDQFAETLQKEVIGAMDKISKGDFDISVNVRDDKDEIAPALIRTIESVKGLESESKKLINAAINGELSTRGDINKFRGGYKDIVNGINQTLDAVITPVNEGVAALSKIAEGDLRVRITSDYKGDHAKIKDSINSLSSSLNGLVGQVSESVQATASASSEISSSTEEMAAGSQEQSAQTTEIAGAVEQMTKTILETTKNASSASEASRNAGLIAKDGGEVVKKTIAGINRISEVVKQSAETVGQLGKSSDQIGEIIQVIDDIADQTNLLALNAAIEAARAR